MHSANNSTQTHPFFYNCGLTVKKWFIINNHYYLEPLKQPWREYPEDIFLQDVCINKLVKRFLIIIFYITLTDLLLRHCCLSFFRFFFVQIPFRLTQVVYYEGVQNAFVGVSGMSFGRRSFHEAKKDVSTID